MNDQDKIFVGSGRDFHFQNGGQSLGLTICLNDLWEASKEYGFEYNGKKYIKLKAVSKREPDQHGKTHYVEVDTYRPDSQSGNNGYQQNPPGYQQGPPHGGNNAPQQQSPEPRGNHQYDSRQNPQGYQQYTPPAGPASGGYEDDIPF